MHSRRHQRISTNALDTSNTEELQGASAPPAVEALLLFVEVQSLAGSAPSSDTPAAYATFALDVLSALERLEVLAEPAHPKSTAEARFLSIYISRLQQAVITNDLPARQGGLSA